MQEELTCLVNYLDCSKDVFTLDELLYLKNSVIGRMVLDYVPVVEAEERLKRLDTVEIPVTKTAELGQAMVAQTQYSDDYRPENRRKNK